MLNLLRGALLITIGILPAADAGDFHTDMMRATVKLQHDKSTATGFVLRQATPEGKGTRTILVTAAHVLEMTPGDATSIVYRVAEADGVFRKEAAPLTIRKEGLPLWTKHASEDVAVLAIVPPEKVDLSEINVDLLASDDSLRQLPLHPGQIASILGYPHRVEANEAGFPILRTGPIASYPLLPSSINKRFMLSTNTFEGDSGGPVYVYEPRRAADKDKTDDVRLILGLMHGQHFLDEEMTMVYGSTRLRHRLGLGIVIQAALIRETIERLP